ncbi:1-deoxy-D-xylulose-5-phosphate synthase [Kutzneria sp. NPDC052558]|uniref:1-deoxy-D-xylulose-5-phosphate synthase n=1 Tax=Kutzneria sp. NPDC052558 TaxID=3364121 RepID=UPI0037CAD594
MTLEMAQRSTLGPALTPATLQELSSSQVRALASDIRAFLVDKVCASGGHLGVNLGVVELTLALHRVFRSPRDRILFDTGHQSYVHKIVTGRADGFDTLRARGGLAGYPSQAESVHDLVENSHASTALSYADGLSKADEVLGVRGRRVVAVIGDGAFTGGMCWEAMNNIGAAKRPVIVVLNDNERAYAPASGAFADHLKAIRRSPMRTNIFKQLGFTYLGPVDGHNTSMLEAAFSQASAIDGPVVVHCLTSKGKGYEPAESDEADRFHAVGVVDPATGRPRKAGGRTWTDVFSTTIADIGAERPDVVCLTASMLLPTGLGPFTQRFPDRVFDVGIAEQHMVTSAAGLALGGCHPVVAVYATFLNRAFDQVLMDVALHRLPVTFVLDRAGITGPDGPSHHGMWDLGLLAAVPGLRVAAPRSAQQLDELLREAVNVTSGPTVVRFPKAAAGEHVEAVRRVGSYDVLYEGSADDALIVSMGPLSRACVDAAEQLAAEGIGVQVVDPRWVIPADRLLVELAREHRVVITVEDGGRAGGAGSAFAQAATDAGVTTPIHNLGMPRRFVQHASRQQILDEHGYTAGGIATAIRQALTGGGPYRQEPDKAPVSLV